MRKKIKDDPGCNAKLLAQYKSFCAVVETLTIDYEDKFVYAAAFEKGSNLMTGENADELEAPDAVVLNCAREVVGRRAVADDRNVSHIERAMFVNLHQNDAIGNKKDVIDKKCGENDNPVRSIRLDERNCGGHDEPRQTYRLRS